MPELSRPTLEESAMILFAEQTSVVGILVPTFSQRAHSSILLSPCSTTGATMAPGQSWALSEEHARDFHIPIGSRSRVPFLYFCQYRLESQRTAKRHLSVQ